MEEQFASEAEARLYVVVEYGETLTVIVGAVPLKAIAPGLIVPLIVPLPVTANESVALPPLQIVVEPLIAAVGRAFTVTIALPDKSAPMEEQFASEAEAREYVVAEDGETLTVIVGAVPLNDIAPGLIVPLIVPLPVTAKESVALPPLQIVVEPLIAAVGRALTFTVRVPVKSPAMDVQFASLREATEYVVFDVGETLTEIVGAVPLNGIAPGDNVPLIVPEPVTEMLIDEL
jgi:hypothetical protein